MENCCLIIGNAIDFCILLVAIIAASISYKEFKSHKVKEDNKLLSQPNNRYLRSVDVQFVVRYLRKKDPTDEIPSAYQIDLFLRFFEELGVYLKSKSLKKDDVLNFFGYYFYRFEKSDRGRVLKDKIDNEDEKLVYLNDYRELIGTYPPEWSKEDIDDGNTNPII